MRKIRFLKAITYHMRAKTKYSWRQQKMIKMYIYKTERKYLCVENNMFEFY